MHTMCARHNCSVISKYTMLDMPGGDILEHHPCHSVCCMHCWYIHGFDSEPVVPNMPCWVLLQRKRLCMPGLSGRYIPAIHWRILIGLVHCLP